ncbi:hypothetical protein [Mycolicibacterium diernhoferi]|uniref:hypothetical protein n=1 Tax=Mycolicibacterium diernhoferi TaxID=1801 RepID=UPI0013F5A741|nr:hypothetical protein [Mycolicibacterium diernhoferi]QYL24096.1 hypothetical protein K0O62_07440 [Mycolicibacterium diernhoferi]
MTFEALRRTVDDALAGVRDHAQTLDRIAAGRTDTPLAQTLHDHLGGRPSERPG